LFYHCATRFNRCNVTAILATATDLDEHDFISIFAYQISATMIRAKSLRWRSVATKTAIFLAVIIALRLAFTINATPSSFFSRKPAVIKYYPSVPADIELRPEAVSVMVVGDSISQGGEGDWTWRYRLWEWLKSQEIVVDFVGPFIGTRPQAVAGDIGEVTIPEPLGLPPTGSAITTAVRKAPNYVFFSLANPFNGPKLTTRFAIVGLQHRYRS
jgi:hypothetical protein